MPLDSPQLSEEQHSTSLGSSTPSRAAINPNTQHIFHPMILQRRRRKVKVFSSTDSLENDTAEGEEDGSSSLDSGIRQGNARYTHLSDVSVP